MNLMPLLLLLNSLCFSLARSCTAEEDIRQLDVTYHIQYQLDDGILRTNHQKFSIYYDDDLQLYHLGYYYDSIVNNIVMDEGYRRYYFVFRKGEKQGYRFNPRDSSKNGYLPVDSFLHQRALGTFRWERLASMKPVASFDKVTGVLEELYTSNEMEGDTVRLYFSERFRDYDYSLSPKLDSLKKMKLFRIMVHNNGFNDPVLKSFMPEKNHYFLLEEGKPDNLEPVRHYLDEYRKMNPK